jgi:hypothetical protein
MKIQALFEFAVQGHKGFVVGEVRTLEDSLAQTLLDRGLVTALNVKAAEAPKESEKSDKKSTK